MAKPTITYAVREGQRFNTDTTLVVVSCASCFVKYAIPDSFNRSAIAYPGDSDNGWDICCPFGHTWHYTGESIRDKLNAERDRATRLAAELDQSKASLRGTKMNAARTRKELKSVKERVAHGVCPCCNRTFKQLARHMASQHPNYARPAGALTPSRRGDVDGG